MWAVGYIIIGYILYGVYWVVVNYWPFILTGAFCIWAAPKIKQALSAKWQSYHKSLQDHKERERSQNDLFSRFSDKDIKLLSFHRLYFLMVAIGFVIAYHSVLECYTFARHVGWIRAIPRDYRDVQYVIWLALFCLVTLTVFRMIAMLSNRIRTDLQIFPSYKGLLRHAYTAQNSQAALDYAPALRESAKHHVRSFNDLFVAGHALLSQSPETAYYKNVRLRDTITYLETHFPHTHEDESFRRRYWNYARHIYKLLDFREDPLIEDSMFAQSYPESKKFKEQEARENLKREREKYQNAPQDVWSKQVDMITLKDALELVGMTDVPPVKVLHKLHMAVLEDHKDDPKKAKLTAKAFEILGAQAVKNEMT